MYKITFSAYVDADNFVEVSEYVRRLPEIAKALDALVVVEGIDSTARYSSWPSNTSINNEQDPVVELLNENGCD